jgi:hypothetical protein
MIMVRKSMALPGPAPNWTAIVTGFRMGLEMSGRSRSIVGGEDKSGGANICGAALSRVSPSGAISPCGLCTIVGKAVCASPKQ